MEPSNLLPIRAAVFSTTGVETWSMVKASVMVLVKVSRRESVVGGISLGLRSILTFVIFEVEKSTVRKD